MDDYEQKVRVFFVAVMRKAFMTFDTHKTGFVETNKIEEILNHMGQMFDEGELQDLIDDTDIEGAGKVNFDGFCAIAGKFMEEEDEQAMQHELKEAFRMYDKEGNGYITTAVLREILRALDDKLTNDDLDGMIEEIDSDGSGTVDFEGVGASCIAYSPGHNPSDYHLFAQPKDALRGRRFSRDQEVKEAVHSFAAQPKNVFLKASITKEACATMDQVYSQARVSDVDGNLSRSRGWPNICLP